MRLNSRRRFAWVAILTLSMVLGGAYVARSSHIFSDVPTIASYHNATEWLFNRGVTLGCVSGLYCPNDVVSRASMALFMNRLGIVLTPSFLNSEGFPAIDPDVGPNLCQTTGYMPTYPQRALVHVRVIAISAGAYDLGLFPVYSIDGGASWIVIGVSISALSATATGLFDSATQSGTVDLSPGVTYIFAGRVDRRAGSADPSSAACQTLVEVQNRNPTSSPLSIPARQTPGNSPLRSRR